MLFMWRVPLHGAPGAFSQCIFFGMSDHGPPHAEGYRSEMPNAEDAAGDAAESQQLFSLSMGPTQAEDESQGSLGASLSCAEPVTSVDVPADTESQCLLSEGIAADALPSDGTKAAALLDSECGSVARAEETAEATAAGSTHAGALTNGEADGEDRHDRNAAEAVESRSDAQEHSTDQTQQDRVAQIVASVTLAATVESNDQAGGSHRDDGKMSDEPPEELSAEVASATAMALDDTGTETVELSAQVAEIMASANASALDDTGTETVELSAQVAEIMASANASALDDKDAGVEQEVQEVAADNPQEDGPVSIQSPEEASFEPSANLFPTMETQAAEMETEAVEMETEAVEMETEAVEKETEAVEVETEAVEMETEAAAAQSKESDASSSATSSSDASDASQSMDEEEMKRIYQREIMMQIKKIVRKLGLDRLTPTTFSSAMRSYFKCDLYQTEWRAFVNQSLDACLQELATSPAKRHGPARPKDPTKPKKAKNAFNFFVQTYTQQLQAAQELPPRTELLQRAAAEWRGLSEDQKVLRCAERRSC